MAREISDANWKRFYDRLFELGPLMLEGVPEDYEWWIAEAGGRGLNECGTPLPDVFLARWCDSFYTPEQAVLDTLEHWAHMVITTFKEEVENTFEPEWEPDQLLKQLGKVTLKPNPEFVKELISIAEGRYDARSLGDVPVKQLLFELLPAGSEFSGGSSGLERLKVYLRETLVSLPGSAREQPVDWERLDQIVSLQPEKCYVGTESWNGYVLFEFTFTNRVVLECPIEGNATYILVSDWRQKVRHSKKYLRSNYPTECIRIMHRGDWLDRVRAALAGQEG